MNLRFHWMLPKGGEVAVEAARTIARFRHEILPLVRHAEASRLSRIESPLRATGT